MRNAVFSALMVFASGSLSAASTPADATEIKLISSVGIKSVMEAILPGFDRTSGHKVTALYGAAAGLKTKIDGGEFFDVAILTPDLIDDLIKNGKASARADLAHAVVGLAIRAGAPKPDISTDEKLKAFLLSVKSIAHGDPALGGFGLVYFYKLTAEMGIADALKAKTVISKLGEGATLVAKGDAEIGVGLSSEVVSLAGVQFVPLRADDPTSFVSFAGAVAADAKDADAARALLVFIQAPAAKEIFKARGLMTP